MKSSTRDEVESKFHQVKGKIKEAAGKISGFVNTQAAVDKAGHIARSVTGVQSAKNDLIVKLASLETRKKETADDSPMRTTEYEGVGLYRTEFFYRARHASHGK